MCDVKVWYVESKWKSYDMKPWGANKEEKCRKDRWNAEREAGSSVCSTQGADVHKSAEIVIKPLLILERSSSWEWIWSGFLRKNLLNVWGLGHSSFQVLLWTLESSNSGCPHRPAKMCNHDPNMWEHFECQSCRICWSKLLGWRES